MQLSRRKFLGSLGGLSILGGLAASTLTGTTATCQLVQQEIPLPSLPRPFDGFRIGFLTDVHLGMFLPHEWVTAALRLLTSSGIDLLLLGGDYVWVPDEWHHQALFTPRNPRFVGVAPELLPTLVFNDLAELILPFVPSSGACAVLGNHDWWVGPRECAQAFVGRGIRVLINSSVDVKRDNAVLTIVGVDDYWNGVPRLPLLPPRSQLPSGEQAARLLITHNPDFLTAAIESPSFDFDLTVAGHTHGGQMKFPMVGALQLGIRDLRFGEGLLQLPQGFFYTSRGLGFVEIPYRINCPPEVTIFTLRKP